MPIGALAANRTSLMPSNISRKEEMMPIGAPAGNRTSLMPSNISRKEK